MTLKHSTQHCSKQYSADFNADRANDDGGWWQMFANLVNKYGLVPKSAYPESANSRNSDAFKQYLNTKLREFASDLRDRHTAGTSLDELRGDGFLIAILCALTSFSARNSRSTRPRGWSMAIAQAIMP